jgi:hypothetical protein
VSTIGHGSTPSTPSIPRVIGQTVTDRFALYHGDCCEAMRGIPDKSVDYSIFSPPFASLYTYSNSPRDIGNVRDDEEFFAHFFFSYFIQLVNRHKEIGFGEVSTGCLGKTG